MSEAVQTLTAFIKIYLKSKETMSLNDKSCWMLLRLEIIQGLNCSWGVKFIGFSVLQEMLMLLNIVLLKCGI